MQHASFLASSKRSFLDLTLYQYGWGRHSSLQPLSSLDSCHYLFFYILSGTGSLRAPLPEGGVASFPITPNQGFLLFPGQPKPYCVFADSPWKSIWLEFDGLQAAECLKQAGLDIAHPLYFPENTEAEELLLENLLYIVEHPEASCYQLVGRLYLFLDALIQSSALRQARQGGQLQSFYIREAISFMEHHYHQPITVEEIAAACKLNRSYFSRIFKDAMGCSPQEYLIRLRMAKAVELLKLTDQSIEEIAVKSGYPSSLHFSRSFKKRFLLSPKEWRMKNGHSLVSSMSENCQITNKNP